MSSNEDDNSWSRVDVDEAVSAQIRKIEYEQEARRKLNDKEFPQRVDATADDSSTSNNGESLESHEFGMAEEKVTAETVEEETTTADELPPQRNEILNSTIDPLASKLAVPTAQPISSRGPIKLPQIQPLVLYPTTAKRDRNEPSPVDSLPQTQLTSHTAPTPSTLPTPKTRLQFSPLALPPPSADGFAQILKERTRQRRAQEDAAVSAVRVQVTRLEAALAAESKRRVAALQLLREQASQAAEDMHKQLQDQMKEEMQSVNARLDKLEERLGGLESKYEYEMTAIRQDIARDAERLNTQLRSLQGQVAREEEKLQTRHKQTMDHMQSVSDSYADRWKEERQQRLKAVQNLNETMQTVHSSRAQNLATFEGQLSHELEQLKLAVENESGERQMYDQEIVDALNRYIQQLQESLAQAVTQGRVY